MSGTPRAASEPETSAEAQMLERNGIVKETFARYRVDGFLYSNVADALAQVRRGSAIRSEARS